MAKTIKDSQRQLKTAKARLVFPDVPNNVNEGNYPYMWDINVASRAMRGDGIIRRMAVGVTPVPAKVLASRMGPQEGIFNRCNGGSGGDCADSC